MHSRTPRLPRPRTDLRDAELRRLDREVGRLAALADADPILVPMLGAMRACRDQLARSKR